MQSAKKNQYKWLHEPIEVSKEERAKMLKKRQESPTQVSFNLNLRVPFHGHFVQQIVTGWDVLYRFLSISIILTLISVC